MKNSILLILFCLIVLLRTCALAQNADQSSSDAGVLVSSNLPSQGDQQDSLTGNPSENASSADNKGSRVLSSDTARLSNHVADDIVIKSAKVIMFQVTANMKLTQDQIAAVQDIIEDNISDVRDLQDKLVRGLIDGKTMYSQRQQLIDEENEKLSHIFSPDQMKIWDNIQNS